MTIFQIVAVLFALFMIYVVSIHGKKKTLSFTEVSFWCTTWILFAIIAMFPNLLSGISSTLRFSRIFDLLVVAALMVLSVVVFSNYFANKALTQKLETFVRDRAITDLKKALTHEKNSRKTKHS